MKRRDFVAALLSTCGIVPILAHAQRSAQVIGFLSNASPGPYAPFVSAFREGLRVMGFVEGENIQLEFRWAEGNYDELAELAASLVRRKVSVIVASGGGRSAPIAKRATSSIPIVFSVGSDP